jgi:uncharacterized membrane protein YphA (DoxX/SURF4 family)
MARRSEFPALGVYVYGCGSIATGIVDLVWRDFATTWQPIQAFGDVAHREALAIAASIALIAGGAAVLLPRTARTGSIILGVVYAAFAVFWLPRVVGFPQIFATWAGFLQEFSLTAAALVVWGGGAARAGRILYGICVMSYALAHFTSLKQTAEMVPQWIPPNGTFWAILTGIAFLCAAIAILSGVLDVLASRLLTAMLVAFGILVWLPIVIAFPQTQSAWAGNAINLALAGAAWVVADAIARRRHLLS